MTTIDDTLVVIENHLDKGHGKEPETLLRRLLDDIGPQELRDWQLDLQRIVERFQPRRRAELNQALQDALGRGAARNVEPVPESISDEDLAHLEDDFRAALRELSQRHIFQWSTFYRDCLNLFSERMVQASDGGTKATVFDIARRGLAEHSNEIFSKGYAHLRGQQSSDHGHAIRKGLGGLSKFVDIVVELYTAHASTSADVLRIEILRRLVSAFLSGILEGFSAVAFGNEGGGWVLSQHARSWAHYFAFLTSRDARLVCDVLGEGDFVEGVRSAILPVLAALERIHTTTGGLAPAPFIGQFLWDERRLDILLRPPASSDDYFLLEVSCFLDGSLATTRAVQEAGARGAELIVAVLKPDVAEFVESHPQLQHSTVVAADSTQGGRVEAEAYQILYGTYYRRFSPREAHHPLTYNIAQDFPLRDPFRARYYHVPRSSVRDHLRTFERKNGVRLWCSVRRSGKTTACFDLGTTTGDSVIVSQTCDSTEQVEDAHLFYDLVLEALASENQLDSAFVASAVEQCAPPNLREASRYVLVIDEYETLFGRLRAAVRKDLDLRYVVVQPLLNQLVAFAKDNLLVFMGQQPNAHFILMDQNQLSAYVQQDSFPLFEHNRGTTAGEFAEFVRKVLSERIAFDGGFADLLYNETSGHPFLTANALVELVQWLIDCKRPARNLRVRSDDMQEFTRARLAQDRIKLASEYDFFRSAISEAMSIDGQRQTPWLYAVYSVLRAIAEVSPEAFRVTRVEFSAMCSRMGLESLGFDPDEILRTGAQANFFRYDDNSVTPRIRLLARIAASTRPRLVA